MSIFVPKLSIAAQVACGVVAIASLYRMISWYVPTSSSLCSSHQNVWSTTWRCCISIPRSEQIPITAHAFSLLCSPTRSIPSSVKSFFSLFLNRPSCRLYDHLFPYITLFSGNFISGNCSLIVDSA